MITKAVKNCVEIRTMSVPQGESLISTTSVYIYRREFLKLIKKSFPSEHKLRIYKSFYQGLKAVYGPKHRKHPSVKSKDGKTLITDPTGILNRWVEHF